MTPLWSIVHLDLKEEVPPLQAVVSAEGVFVVLWWRNIPLGHLTIKAAQLPVSAAQLSRMALQTIEPAITGYGLELGVGIASERPSRLQDVLARLEPVLCQPLAQVPLDQSTMSVVIPTYNRPEKLSACLQSLQGLRQPPEDIVVVDNAPQAPMTRHLVAQFPNVRYLVEPRRGASVARNTGVRHCKTSLVAFVDDDETVHADWLTWLRQCFHDPGVALATGLVLPAELMTKAQLLFERRFSFVRGYHPRTFDTAFFKRSKSQGVPVWCIGGSGNMAIRRDVFEQVGGFDERLGAGQAGCSEDTELFYRVLAQGWHCRYDPRSVVYHQHRRDMNDLKQQVFSYMRGHVVASLVQYARHKDRGNIRHLLWTLPKIYAWYCLRSLTRDPAFQLGLLRAEMAGYLSGWRCYRRQGLHVQPHL